MTASKCLKWPNKLRVYSNRLVRAIKMLFQKEPFIGQIWLPYIWNGLNFPVRMVYKHVLYVDLQKCRADHWTAPWERTVGCSCLILSYSESSEFYGQNGIQTSAFARIIEVSFNLIWSVLQFDFNLIWSPLQFNLKCPFILSKLASVAGRDPRSLQIYSDSLTLTCIVLKSVACGRPFCVWTTNRWTVWSKSGTVGTAFLTRTQRYKVVFTLTLVWGLVTLLYGYWHSPVMHEQRYEVVTLVWGLRMPRVYSTLNV